MTVWPLPALGEYDSMYLAWQAKSTEPLPSSSGHSEEHVRRCLCVVV